MSYIKKSDLIKAVEDEIFINPTIRSKFKQIIHKQPTADVVEVRHGTWYHGTENGIGYAKCTACSGKMNIFCYGCTHCCLCGAKMDGERKEKNENY